jgi:hypothetical protein
LTTTRRERERSQIRNKVCTLHKLKEDAQGEVYIAQDSVHNNNSTFINDSGATYHIVHDIDLPMSFININRMKIKVGGN